MTKDVDASYSRAFRNLLIDEGLADPEVFAQVDAYDEVPLYSRLRQIAFLDSLPIAEQNRQLIRASVRHLDRITEHFRRELVGTSNQLLRLVSITGWWVDGEQGGACTDGTSEIVQPHFWIGNLAHERMKDFRLYRPESRCAAFVADAVETASHSVFESRLDESVMWCPRRVYVGRDEDLQTRFLS